MRSLLAGHRPATSSLSKLGAPVLGSLRPTAKLLSTARPLSTTKPLSTTRPLSTALATDHSDDKWESDFLAATATIRSDVSHEESAACLRELVRSGLLRHTDLRDHPERFFKAHRLLARHAVEHGPGFWIRFTVHYKCAATAAQTPRRSSRRRATSYLPLHFPATPRAATPPLRSDPPPLGRVAACASAPCSRWAGPSRSPRSTPSKRRGSSAASL